MSFMFPKEQDNPFIPEGPVPGELSASLLMRSAFTLEGRRTSLGGVADRFAEERRASREESATLAAEDATKKYGIQGQLSFSSPIKESVAKVLNRRKQEELEYEKILATADGFTQKGAVFTAALGSSLFDPLTLGASAIPIVGEARWAALIGKYGVVRGRVIGGAIEGGVGNALMEPALLYQAHRDQMNYGPMDSLINVGMGVGIGGGIGLAAGKWNRHVAAVRQKTHLQALRVASNQLAAGKNVEVDPIVKSSAMPEDLGKAINLDTGEPDFFMPGSDLPPDMVSNAPPPYFITGGIGKEGDGWKTEAVYPEGLSVGDYFTLHDINDGGAISVYGAVIDVHADGKLEYEVINDPEATLMSGQTASLSTQDLDHFEIQVHSPMEGYVPPDFKPLVEDKSPLMGDSDQEAIDIMLHMKHEEALNWENLTDSVPVDSDQYAGTHVGAFMRDMNTDKVYYTKYPNDVEQTRQEYIAYLFYKLTGINVPEVRPIFQDGKLVGIGSKSLETDEWSIPQNQSELTMALEDLEKTSPEMVREFREGAIIDAWLGNRDFTAPGNVVIVLEGPQRGIYRIDYGGSLDYRAGGEKKPEGHAGLGLGLKVGELNSFLDPAYPQAKILGAVHQERLASMQSGLERLAGINDDEILSVVYSVGLPQEDAARLSSTLIARRGEILAKWGDFLKKGSGKVYWESFNKQQSSKFLKRAAKFFQVISKEAEYHLDDYKGVAYGTLNDWLRKGKTKLKSHHPKMGEQLEGAMKAMDEATRAYTFQTTTYLWRAGVPTKAFELPKDFDLTDTDALMKLIGGKPFYDKGFMSTSIDRDFAMTWSGGNKFVLRLQVPPGQTSAIPGAKYLQKAETDPHYQIDTEYEFILPRDTKMVVTGAYFNPYHQATVLNVKVVPHTNVKPITSKQFIDVAKKYQQAPVIGADDEGIPEELVYSLKESMDLDDTETLVTQLDRDSNDLLTLMKQYPEIPEESFKQINDNYATMVAQAKGMTNGAFAAHACVMKNANI